MSTLLENPIPIIVFGIVAEAVLRIVLLRTGRGVVLWAMAGVLVLVLAGVGLEWAVVTEVERVEATFDDLAAALENNDREAVLEYLDPAAVGTRHEAQRGLRQVTFTEVKVTHLEVDVISTTSPPTAKALVTGSFHFEGRSGIVPRSFIVLEAMVTLRKKAGRWVIVGHEWKKRPI